MLAISTFAVITVLISFANQRWQRLLPITHGVPVIIVRSGEPDLKALTADRMSVQDLFAAAHEQGFRRIFDIELAVLEADGKISFFDAEDDGKRAASEASPAG